MWAGAHPASFPPAWSLSRLPSQVRAGCSPVLLAGGCSWGEQGTRGVPRVALRGEVVLLQGGAAQGRQEKAGQGQLTEAGLPYWRRVGTGRVGQQGQIRVCFLSSHLPSNSYCLCTFLLRWPRVCFCFCTSINDMANINQITLKGKREIQQCWRVSSPARQRIKSLNRRGLLQECSLFVFHTAMVCWQRTGGCSSIRRGEV